MREILRLVRLPNTLTVIADVLAGAALGGGIHQSGDVTAVAMTAPAMMLLYAFGVTLNDWADREKDAVAHPDRPLPSGRVSEGAAKSVMFTTIAVATMLLAPLGLESFLVACALVVAITLYDTVFPERTLSSALAMGACRALSMAAGVAAVHGDLRLLAVDGGWIGPAAYAGLVAGLTLLSTFEDDDVEPGVRLPLALAVIVAAMCAPGAIPGAGYAVPAGGLLLASWSLLPVLAAPRRYGLAVRNVVFGLPLFCALICLAAEAPVLAACAAAIFPLTRLTARAIGQRGS